MSPLILTKRISLWTTERFKVNDLIYTTNDQLGICDQDVCFPALEFR